MKERFTPEERLQFIKQFGVVPEITPRESSPGYYLATFDPKLGYARFEEAGEHINEEHRRTLGGYVEYMRLNSKTGLIGIRRGTRGNSDRWPDTPEAEVSFLQNDIVISYKPERTET